MSQLDLEEAVNKLEKIKARSNPKYSTKELVRKGVERYNEIAPVVEPQNVGKFIVIEVDTGDYFIDDDSVKATLKAKKCHPQSVFYLGRIGSPAAFTIRGHVPLL